MSVFNFQVVVDQQALRDDEIVGFVTVRQVRKHLLRADEVHGRSDGGREPRRAIRVACQS